MSRKEIGSDGIWTIPAERSVREARNLRQRGNGCVSRGRTSTSETRTAGWNRRSATRLHHLSRVGVSGYHRKARRGGTWTVYPICHEIFGSARALHNRGANRHQGDQSCKKERKVGTITFCRFLGGKTPSNSP